MLTLRMMAAMLDFDVSMASNLKNNFPFCFVMLKLAEKGTSVVCISSLSGQRQIAFYVFKTASAAILNIML